MQLLLVRHGIAEASAGPRGHDRERALTPRGERRFVDAARALARLLPKPRAILTSPLLRARQTADLAARAWGGPRPRRVAALATGDWARIRRVLAEYADGNTVALVGHEDWLSQLTAGLLGGAPAASLRYRKGGVALIALEPGTMDRGRLLWFIPPRVFRRLAVRVRKPRKPRSEG